MNFGGRRSGAASLALFFTWHSTSFTPRLLSLLPAFPRHYFSTATATTLRPETQLCIAKSPSSLHLFKYPHLSPAFPIAYHHVVSHPTSPPSIIHPTLASSSSSDPFNPLNSIIIPLQRSLGFSSYSYVFITGWSSWSIIYSSERGLSHILGIWDCILSSYISIQTHLQTHLQTM